MTRTWDEEMLREIAVEISDKVRWVFAQVKRNVFSKDGWGLTVTVFAKTPSELSEKLVKAVELAETELSRRGVDFSRKNMSELV